MCVGLDTALDLCARSRPPAGVRPVHEAPCFVDGRLLFSPAPSHQELHQVVAYWAAKAAVAAFITSRVDRYNSLLAGGPACLLDGLQSVLNATTRLICNRRKHDHVAPLLRDVLDWLPVPFRIEYKLCLLVFLSLHGAPQSTCAVAALGLIPPRLGYVYDHLRRPISGCRG